MFVIDTDYGCGIIRKGKQSKIPMPQSFPYELYQKSRSELMNIKTLTEFIDWL